MDVAGNTAGEGVAFADQFVEGFVFVGVYAANYAGERLGAVTQHVNIRIDNGLGEGSRTAVYEGSPVRFFRAELFHDVGPDLAGCTQLRDFHEEVGALVEFKSDSLGNFMNAQTPFQHLAYVFNRYCISIGNFLYAFCPAQGENSAADQDGAQARSIFSRPFDNSSHLVVQFVQRFRGLAVLNQFADRIGAHDAVEFFNLFAGSFHGRNGHSQQTGGAFPCIQHKG